ncbi:MAG: hypothetical protein LBL34_04315, partial [Clostridiales bacterium]|nr:hypothetical protein [Clostridiales bacterium]
ITITRRGTPIAMLVKPTDNQYPNAREAIEGLLATRHKFSQAFEEFDNEGLKTLAEEGRM